MKINKPLSQKTGFDICNILEETTRTYIIKGKDFSITSRTYKDIKGRRISLGGIFRNMDTGEVIIENEFGKTVNLGIFPSAKYYSFPAMN